MLRRFGIPILLVSVTVPLVRSQDAIPASTLTSVKHATVFIQVSGANWKATGSGFVVSADKDAVLIATNHHVIGLPENEKKARLSPSELSRTLKLVNVTVVFDPGTKSEVSMKAEPVAADPDNDLAVLRVAKVKDPPKPIDYAAAPKLTETMQVYTFGFPFGSALATGKGAPAITVGKGSISSLRLDDSGDLAVVQIDGALNPGNSGGPVVDAKGQLVGVAVATIKNGQGIGFAVPGAELGKIMRGRLGAVHASTTLVGGKKTTRADVEVVDPTGAVKGVTVWYAVVPAGGAKPTAGEPLSKHASAKSVVLKTAGDLAGGELGFEPVDGTLYVQAVPEGGLGDKGASGVRSFTMSAARGVSGAGGAAANGPAVNITVPAIGAKPPEGWKEHVPKDKTYVVWIPVKNAGQRDNERTQISNGLRLKFNTLLVELGAQQRYVVEEILVPAGATNNRRAEFEDLLRDLVAETSHGKLADSFEVRMGLNRGKEYRIETAAGQVRARVYVVSNRLMLLRAEGSKEFVEAADAGTFLDSCRLMAGAGNVPPPKVNPPPAIAGPNPMPNPGPKPFNGAGPGPAPGPPAPTVADARKSKIVGFPFADDFVDEGPPGGLLVGVEVGLGKFLNNDVVHAVRPIYRAGTSESTGTWRGSTDGKEMQRILAKPGYAVGAITVKRGLGVDGFSMTFMRVADGKLDWSEKYDSPWIGGKGGDAEEKVGGDGRLVVGLIGKTRNEIRGLGLLYPDPSKPSPPPNISTTSGPGVPESPDRAVRPPTTSPADSSAAPAKKAAPEEGPAEKSSNLPLIILGVAGAGVFLLAAIGGALFLVHQSGKKQVGKRSRQSERDDDNDRDDDDRPRRRGRSDRNR